MTYWMISFSWAVLGTAVFWCVLSSKWKKIDPLYASCIHSYRILEPIIPGDPGYLDIKFTLVRHGFTFLVSSFIIYFVKVKFILSIILIMNGLYALSTISRYNYRRRYLQEEAKNPDNESSISIISIPVKDSLCAVVYSVLCVVILYILYVTRP